MDTTAYCEGQSFRVGFNTNEKWTWTTEHRKCLELTEFVKRVGTYVQDEFLDRIEHYICGVPGCDGKASSNQRCPDISTNAEGHFGWAKHSGPNKLLAALLELVTKSLHTPEHTTKRAQPQALIASQQSTPCEVRAAHSDPAPRFLIPTILQMTGTCRGHRHTHDTWLTHAVLCVRLQVGYVDTAPWCKSNGPFYVGYSHCDPGPCEEFVWTTDHRKCIEAAEYIQKVSSYAQDGMNALPNLEAYVCDVPGIEIKSYTGVRGASDDDDDDDRLAIKITYYRPGMQSTFGSISAGRGGGGGLMELATESLHTPEHATKRAQPQALLASQQVHYQLMPCEVRAAHSDCAPCCAYPQLLQTTGTSGHGPHSI